MDDRPGREISSKRPHVDLPSKVEVAASRDEDPTMPGCEQPLHDAPP
jgi:hypothetical protein